MNSSASVADLAPGAVDALRRYCAPGGPYAWPAYDTDANTSELTSIDVLAPAFLSYPIRGSYLNQMFQRNDQGGPGNDYASLFDAMAAVVADADAAELDFGAIDTHDLVNPDRAGWGLVLKANDAVRPCRGLRSVAVTKILHRKRPHLVPINDSRIRAFFGIADGSYSKVFGCIHEDVTTQGDLLDTWRQPYMIGKRPMSRLRALDIVVWMHFEDGGGIGVRVEDDLDDEGLTDTQSSISGGLIRPQGESDRARMARRSGTLEPTRRSRGSRPSWPTASRLPGECEYGRTGRRAPC